MCDHEGNIEFHEHQNCAYVYHSYNTYLAIDCFNLCCKQGIMCEGKPQEHIPRLQVARSQNARYKILWWLPEIVQCDGCN